MKLPKLPSRDSATWRSVVTGCQAFIGMVITMLAMPEFRQLVDQFYPQALPTIVFASALASFVFNYLRKDVQNY